MIVRLKQKDIESIYHYLKTGYEEHLLWARHDGWEKDLSIKDKHEAETSDRRWRVTYQRFRVAVMEAKENKNRKQVRRK